MRTILQVLQDARAVVEQYWLHEPGFLCKDTETEYGASVVGAVLWSASNNSELRVRALDALITANGCEDSSALQVWNDRPERTREDVLALYDTAIAGVQ